MASRQNDTITIRVPREITSEVRQLAAQDVESQAVIYRRLLKLGLPTEHERRSAFANDTDGSR
jgi:hypothetical protein